MLSMLVVAICMGVSLPAAAGRVQGLLGPAVIGDVDRGAGSDDLVDAVQHVVGELDVGGGELGFKVVHGARADDRGGDGRVAEHERQRKLNQGDAGVFGELGEWSAASSLRWLAASLMSKRAWGRAAELGPWTRASLR